MTTPDANEQGSTAPIELPGHQPPPPPAPAPSPQPASESPDPIVLPAPRLPVDGVPAAPTSVARTVAPDHPDVTYVPLAVSIGDGFKFGCGFFLAIVLALLVGFVLLAALFVITGLFGLSLPIGR